MNVRDSRRGIRVSKLTLGVNMLLSHPCRTSNVGKVQIVSIAGGLVVCGTNPVMAM